MEYKKKISHKKNIKILHTRKTIPLILGVGLGFGSTILGKKVMKLPDKHSDNLLSAVVEKIPSRYLDLVFNLCSVLSSI